jgi:hypothetical protein
LFLRCADGRQDASNTVAVRPRDQVGHGRKCSELDFACRGSGGQLVGYSIQHGVRERDCRARVAQ